MTFLRVVVYAREHEFYSAGDEFSVLTRESVANDVSEVQVQGSLATLGAYLKLEEKVKSKKRKEEKSKKQ